MLPLKCGAWQIPELKTILAMSTETAMDLLARVNLGCTHGAPWQSAVESDFRRSRIEHWALSRNDMKNIYSKSKTF